MPRHSYGLHGVFLGSHAVAEGFVTQRQLKAGLYRRLLRNVYADPALPADHRLVAHGAALTMPATAVLGGITAAAWFGAPFASTRDPVVVIAPPDSAWRGPRGVRVHRAAVAEDEVLVVDDPLGPVRVTAPYRTAWDVAALEPAGPAVGFLDGMARAGHLATETLHDLLSRSSGRWGAAKVRRAVPLIDPRSESPPESWVRVACVRAGLPAPVPQYEVVQDGLLLGRVDLAWPEQRVIVEYEGAYHFAGVQIAKDDARIARLQAAGWCVIRVAAHDLRDMDAVVGRIARELRART